MCACARACAGPGAGSGPAPSSRPRPALGRQLGAPARRAAGSMLSLLVWILTLSDTFSQGKPRRLLSAPGRAGSPPPGARARLSRGCAQVVPGRERWGLAVAGPERAHSALRSLWQPPCLCPPRPGVRTPGSCGRGRGEGDEGWEEGGISDLWWEVRGKLGTRLPKMPRRESRLQPSPWGGGAVQPAWAAPSGNGEGYLGASGGTPARRGAGWGEDFHRQLRGRLDIQGGTWRGGSYPTWGRESVDVGAYLELAGEKLGNEGEVERDEDDSVS